MANNSGDSGDKSQADKFREAAREHETDDSEERFDKMVKRIAKTSSKEGATNRAGKK